MFTVQIWNYDMFTVQIWNYDAQLAVNDTILKKVHTLVPDVTFLAEFFKRKTNITLYNRQHGRSKKLIISILKFDAIDFEMIERKQKYTKSIGLEVKLD